MKNLPTVRATLCLSADLFDLEFVTRRIGVDPTKTRSKDSFRTKEFAHTEWIVDVLEENCWSISAPLDRLYEQIGGKVEIIKSLCNECSIETAIIVSIHMNHGHGERPEMDISREIIALAAAINAKIGFDLYCYEEEI